MLGITRLTVETVLDFGSTHSKSCGPHRCAARRSSLGYIKTKYNRSGPERKSMSRSGQRDRMSQHLQRRFMSTVRLIPGFPCADCMRATGEDLTLTAERDPLFPPYPSRPANETSSFSRECRWSIRFYLHALAPDTSATPHTMTRMCNIIVKWGPMTIVCIKDQFPEIAYQFFGQLVRCEFAMEILGNDWGTEKAEESIFIDAYTNRTARAADFITEGFPPMPDGSRRSLKEEAPLLLHSDTVV
jgi:hypothetical protein